MKRSLALAVAMIFASGTALAMHCPQDMKAIDEALTKPHKLTPKQLELVKKQRAEGEALHKAGKHAESVDILGRALATIAGTEYKPDVKGIKK